MREKNKRHNLNPFNLYPYHALFFNQDYIAEGVLNLIIFSVPFRAQPLLRVENVYWGNRLLFQSDRNWFGQTENLTLSDRVSCKVSQTLANTV